MAAIRATVLIPTHEHGGLLRLAAASALVQTVRDLEVFIVLDGPDLETKKAADEVARADSRVRLFPNEKGERNGEAHRHVALREARGRIVCYLSDDDLWFPDHVEYLEHLLEDADFAHSLTVVALPEGGFHIPYLGDLADPWYRDWLVGPHNFIPLPATGHALEAYRSLPVGWSPAPPTVWTDLHMWRKFLAAPGLRLKSGGRPTLLHFPSPARRHMDLPARLAEMESWHTALQAPGAWQALRVNAYDRLPAQAAGLQRERLELDADLGQTRLRLTEAEQAAAALREQQSVAEQEAASLRAEQAADRAQLGVAEREIASLKAEQATDRARLAESATRIDRLAGELSGIQGSVAYRASRRLAAIPVIGRLGRWVGRAIAGRGGR